MPRLPEGRKQFRGYRLSLSKTLEKEFFPFKTQEEDDGYDQRKNDYDRRNEAVWNYSALVGFGKWSKHGLGQNTKTYVITGG